MESEPKYAWPSEGKSGQPGKTVYVKIGIWYDEKKGHIHIAAPGVDGFHTTVTDKEGSIRYHGNLYEN